MAVDLQRQSDGRLHFSLGPVERWVAAIVAAAVLSMVAWLANSFSTRLDRMEQLLGTSATQQAVTNAQMSTLSSQLADVPQLTRQMAEIQVQVKRNSEDIAELRRLRGIR